MWFLLGLVFLASASKFDTLKDLAVSRIKLLELSNLEKKVAISSKDHKDERITRNQEITPEKEYETFIDELVPIATSSKPETTNVFEELRQMFIEQEASLTVLYLCFFKVYSEAFFNEKEDFVKVLYQILHDFCLNSEQPLFEAIELYSKENDPLALVYAFERFIGSCIGTTTFGFDSFMSKFEESCLFSLTVGRQEQDPSDLIEKKILEQDKISQTKTLKFQKFYSRWAMLIFFNTAIIGLFIK